MPLASTIRLKATLMPACSLPCQLPRYVTLLNDNLPRLNNIHKEASLKRLGAQMRGNNSGILEAKTFYPGQRQTYSSINFLPVIATDLISVTMLSSHAPPRHLLLMGPRRPSPLQIFVTRAGLQMDSE